MGIDLGNDPPVRVGDSDDRGEDRDAAVVSSFHDPFVTESRHGGRAFFVGQRGVELQGGIFPVPEFI